MGLIQFDPRIRRNLEGHDHGFVVVKNWELPCGTPIFGIKVQKTVVRPFLQLLKTNSVVDLTHVGLVLGPREFHGDTGVGSKTFDEGNQRIPSNNNDHPKHVEQCFVNSALPSGHHETNHKSHKLQHAKRDAQHKKRMKKGRLGCTRVFDTLSSS